MVGPLITLLLIPLKLSTNYILPTGSSRIRMRSGKLKSEVDSYIFKRVYMNVYFFLKLNVLTSFSGGEIAKKPGPIKVNYYNFNIYFINIVNVKY